MSRAAARGVSMGAAATLAVGQAWAFPVDSLQSSGDPQNRIDVVILGDGYRDGDQEQLTSDAQALVDYVFSVEPYATYRGLFNIDLVHAISNESGADNGSFGATRDTYFGSTYGCGGIDRLICVNEGLVFSEAAAHVPHYDQIFLLVNDPKYGGAGYPRLAVSSISEFSPEVLTHEIGHSLAALADEYEDPSPGFPGCAADCPEPNATVHTTLSDIKWQAWIEADTPLPTLPAVGGVIGAFEGARYQSAGVYRPASDCKMRNLGAEHCAICSEALAISYYSTVDPIDAVLDATGAAVATSVIVNGCQSTSFDVARPTVLPDSHEVSWFIDGAPVAAGDTLTIDPTEHVMGAHAVEVTVTDQTDRVRTDPQNVLVGSRKFNVMIDCESSSGSGAAGGQSSTVGVGGGSAGVAGSGGAIHPGQYPIGIPVPGPPPDDGGCDCNLASAPRGGAIGWGSWLLALLLVRRRR